MSFIKHVGKVGDKSVVIIFRHLPGESHNCLVVYNNNLNQNVAEALMRTVNSTKAQSSIDLAESLYAATTNDGRPLLQVLHSEGLLKKVQNNNVLVTPAPGQSVRLGELNTLLDEMAKGEAATKRLAEIDASHGLQKPSDVARRMQSMDAPEVVQTVQEGVLDDAAIATNLLAQASRLQRDAEQILAEVARLTAEASALQPRAPEPVTIDQIVESVLDTPVEEPVVEAKPKKTTRVAKAV